MTDKTRQPDPRVAEVARRLRAEDTRRKRSDRRRMIAFVRRRGAGMDVPRGEG